MFSNKLNKKKFYFTRSLIEAVDPYVTSPIMSNPKIITFWQLPSEYNTLQLDLRLNHFLSESSNLGIHPILYQYYSTPGSMLQPNQIRDRSTQNKQTGSCLLPLLCYTVKTCSQREESTRPIIIIPMIIILR